MTKYYYFTLGGRDKYGGPVIEFPSREIHSEYTLQDLASCINYLSKIPR